MRRFETAILGGGVTGLAASMASGAPVFEAAEAPGGICSSYYLRPGDTKRLFAPLADGNAYRFEIGGGHWIFGGDPIVKNLLNRLAPMNSYTRRSSVFFPDTQSYVPFPIQNHLGHLDRTVADRAVGEIATCSGTGRTMRDWFHGNFGPTLCELFFDPFHELYTAGLYDSIAPQDAYKSPVDIHQVRRGLEGRANDAGYNVTFLYPQGGLDRLAQEMAARGHIEYAKRVVGIDTERRLVTLADETTFTYDRLLATLPLNRMLELTGIEVPELANPHTSVLVLNIGAQRGRRCPNDHWMYVPRTGSGFCRVGVYSNVDSAFVPRGREASVASFYVERAFLGSQRPDEGQVHAYAAAVIDELKAWEFLGDVEAVDPTWIDVAYTWHRPGSTWARSAITQLEARQIYPIGRYARWHFQGIADSIRDGLFAGAAMARGARCTE